MSTSVLRSTYEREKDALQAGLVNTSLKMDAFSNCQKLEQGSQGTVLIGTLGGVEYILKQRHTFSLVARRSAFAELQILSLLKHPHIIRFEDCFEEDDALYIVMEYAAAGSLYGLLQAQTQLLDEHVVVDIIVQVALALKHAHDRKVLHRDLKSRNIFLTSSGVVKVGDFGCSTVITSTVEHVNSLIGTPYYIAPEIFDSQPYNAKCDVWALGVLSYEVATLKLPFTATSLPKLTCAILSAEFKPLGREHSKALSNLVTKMLMRDPAMRPRIHEVLDDPFLWAVVPKFLNEDSIESEFSHTILHGQHLLPKALPPLLGTSESKETPSEDTGEVDNPTEQLQRIRELERKLREREDGMSRREYTLSRQVQQVQNVQRKNAGTRQNITILFGAVVALLLVVLIVLIIVFLY